jgi:hypothetical protein
MDDDREVWLARTFVELADTLIADFDLVEFLSMVVERCAVLLDGPEVGLAIASPAGQLRVLASSSERMRVLELVEIQSEEGPCRDAYLSGRQVLNMRIDAAQTRWPSFGPRARDAGFQMLHALPMRLRGRLLGAVNIFDTRVREMTAQEANMAQAFSDVATIGILQQRSVRDQAVLSNQLSNALQTRVVIEQAKGIVGEALHVGMDEAFNLMRGYARRNNLRLTAAARSVVAGSLPAAILTVTSKDP